MRAIYLLMSLAIIFSSGKKSSEKNKLDRDCEFRIDTLLHRIVSIDYKYTDRHFISTNIKEYPPDKLHYFYFVKGLMIVDQLGFDIMRE
jgi:hypothetical protein